MKQRSGVGTAIVAVLVIIIIVIGGVAAFYALSSGNKTSTVTSTAISISTATSTAISISTATSTAISTATSISTATTTATLSPPTSSSSTISSESYSGPAGNQTLTIDTSSEATGFDPAAATANNGYSDIAMGFIYDGYTTLNYQNTTQVEPDLATSWTTNANSTVWTFNLQQGVTFQDGEPFNAYAVQYSLQRDVNNTGFVFPAVVEGLTTQIINNYTIQLTFPKPQPLLLQYFAQPEFYPVAPLAAAKLGTSLTTDPALVGTGPFEFVSWQHGVSITFKQNPNYWGGPSYYGHKGPANLQTIVLRLVNNPTTILNDLTTGEADVTLASLTASSYATLPHYLDETPDVGYGEEMMFFNLGAAPTSNIDVRLAIASLIDRNTLATDVDFNTREPQFTGFVSQFDSFGQNATAQSLVPQYNTTAAANYLTAAGYHRTSATGSWVDSSGKELTVNIVSIDSVAATVLSTDLEQFGITTQTSVQDVATAFASFTNGNYDVGISGTGAAIITQPLGNFFTKAGVYNTRIENVDPRVNASLAALSSASTFAGVNAAVEELDGLSIQDAAVFGLVSLAQPFIHGNWIGGWTPVTSDLNYGYTWTNVGINQDLKSSEA
jgi:peptide/nickel transport system substrate-binding protein